MTVIIDYGAGNTESVRLALARLGADAMLTADTAIIRAAERVILPGVGEARAAMTQLQASGLADLLPTLRQPVLGVCLGQQLLTAFSAERDTPCLGILPDLRTERFSATSGLKVPHLGWNQIRDLRGPLFVGIPPGAWVYFVHSYYVPFGAEFTTATADYGLAFSAAVTYRNFHAVQFHPEKSGTTGAQVLQNFLTM
jgi:imidazole glycerol-phosphate synthase subunit HisH